MTLTPRDTPAQPAAQPALAILLVMVAAMLGAAPLSAEALPVAGDDQHLWVVQPARDDDGEGNAPLVVRHRGPGDEANAFNYAGTLTDTQRPLRLAAAGATLWMLETDGTVTTLTASRPVAPMGWQYDQRHEPSLPDGASVRAFDVGEGGRFALLRIDAAEALEQLARPMPEARPWDQWDPLRRMTLNLPPNSPPADSADQQSEQAEPSATQEESAQTAVGLDRLVQLRGSAWRSVPLPDDWPASAAQLVAPEARGEPLRLLARDPADEHTLRVYERRGEEWQRRDYTLNRASAVRALAVDSQLVIAQPVSIGNGRVTLHLSVLRNGRELPLGELTVEAPGARRWGVAPMEGSAALVVASNEPAATDRAETVNQLWWARMNLQGQVLAEPAQLEAPTGTPLGRVADYAILVAVLVLAVLMMLLFWRRDVEQYRLELPAEVVLAGLLRRAAAGALDLAPAMAVAMLVYRIDLQELMMFRWPGQGQADSWTDIAPGGLAIGVFLAHTCLCELIFARSLGKALMGLRVHTIKGERPRAWQVLVRNALKSFDLVAWLLLLLPVLGPYRQRLGDLVARTVVTMPAPSEQNNDE
ncbi:MAG: RDD family protein [Phycisphaeraceae bacterium]